MFADIGGLEDMKRIYGIIAVGGRVKLGRDVKVHFFVNYYSRTILETL